MNVKILKIKNTVMDKQPIILSCLILLFIISLMWGAYTYPAPTTTSESFVSSHYTHFGEYDYFAQVTKPNMIYVNGTILDESYPAYFFTMSPNATINFSYGYNPSDSAKMDITIKTKVIASSTIRRDDEAPFWTKTYSSDTRKVTLKDDQIYTDTYLLPVQDIQATIAKIKKNLKYSQSASAEIVTTVTSKGTINGEPVTIHEQYTLPIIIEASYYQLTGVGKVEETTNNYDSREIVTYPTALDKVIPFILPALFLILTILFYVYHEYYFVETEQAVIDFLQIEKDIDDLSDWISEGSMPEKYTAIAINSLKDLVNLSIDTSSRVIHDEEKNVYFSMSNGVMYLFELGEQQL